MHSNKIKPKYPISEFRVRGLAYYGMSYGEVKGTIHINTSDWNYKGKQVLFFSIKDFKKMVMDKNANNEYLYPECAEIFRIWGNDTRFAIEELNQDKKSKEEITYAVLLTGRVEFERNIGHLVTEMPMEKDMPVKAA